MIYEQKSTKTNPNKSGWYNTSKGELFWFNKEQQWSCREDRISEEYPDVWYREIADIDDINLAHFKEVMDFFHSEKICTDLTGKDLLQEYKIFKSKRTN